jgi:tetratricopeptide (TPR) repeat protein
MTSRNQPLLAVHRRRANYRTLLLVTGSVMVLVLSAASMYAQGAATVRASSASKEALAAYETGLALLDNARQAEAVVEFDRAILLDPTFTLARAYRGVATPGAQGNADLQQAVAAAAALPPAERALIEGFGAQRNGDLAGARNAFQRVIELAPGDYRGHQELGRRQLGDQQYDAAERSFRKAIELNQKAASALNQLGYAVLRRGDTTRAITVFTDYVRLMPAEANAHDSLAEAQLAAGRFQGAELEFRRALELVPGLWSSHQGIAYARFYVKDWNGAHAALDQARKLATRVPDRLSLEQDAAAGMAAQGRVDDAVRTLKEAGRTEGAAPLDVALLKMWETRVLTISGRSREARTAIAELLTASEDPRIPQANAGTLRREAWRMRSTLEAQAGDVEASSKTADAAAQLARSQRDNTMAQSVMHYAAGEAALARKDLRGARQHFRQCAVEDDVCNWQMVVAAQQAGQASDAEAARRRVLGVRYRTPLYLLIYARVEQDSGAGATSATGRP